MFLCFQTADELYNACRSVPMFSSIAHKIVPKSCFVCVLDCAQILGVRTLNCAQFFFVVCTLNCVRILVVHTLDCVQFLFSTLPGCPFPTQPSWNTTPSSIILLFSSAVVAWPCLQCTTVFLIPPTTASSVCRTSWSMRSVVVSHWPSESYYC